MKVYFTADTHFGHSKIIDYCSRPFTVVDEMDKTLINNWNKIVSKEDTVFFLGDFCFFDKVEFYKKQLNGNIIFISGNHDTHTPIQEIIINMNGKNILLTHRPEDCLLDLNFCGHIHEKWKFKIDKKNKRIMVNVGVDVWNYKPITYQQIMNELQTYLDGDKKCWKFFNSINHELKSKHL